MFSLPLLSIVFFFRGSRTISDLFNVLNAILLRIIPSAAPNCCCRTRNIEIRFGNNIEHDPNEASAMGYYNGWLASELLSIGRGRAYSAVITLVEVVS